METLAKADTNTVIKQSNPIVLKHSDNKVCKNRIEMPYEDLLKHISEKLMAYAMLLANKDEDDALELIQSRSLLLEARIAFARAERDFMVSQFELAKQLGSLSIKSFK